MDVGTAGLDQSLGETGRTPADRAIHHDRAGVVAERTIHFRGLGVGVDVAGSREVGEVELLAGPDIEEDEVRGLGVGGGCGEE